MQKQVTKKEMQERTELTVKNKSMGTTMKKKSTTIVAM